MWRLLHERFAHYRSAPGERPLLAGAFVDVMAAELHLFDSDSAAVTAEHVAASSASPLMFDPVTTACCRCCCNACCTAAAWRATSRCG